MTRANSLAFARLTSEYTDSGPLPDGNDAIQEQREMSIPLALPAPQYASPLALARAWAQSLQAAQVLAADAAAECWMYGRITGQEATERYQKADAASLALKAAWAVVDELEAVV